MWTLQASLKVFQTAGHRVFMLIQPSSSTIFKYQPNKQHPMNSTMKQQHYHHQLTTRQTESWEKNLGRKMFEHEQHKTNNLMQLEKLLCPEIKIMYANLIIIHPISQICQYIPSKQTPKMQIEPNHF